MPEAVLAAEFTLELEQLHDFEFRVRFDKPEIPDLVLDEAPPLGTDRGPNPSRILAAAIANCLSASLLFCARKSRVRIGLIRAHATVTLVRNERNRLRIGGVRVEIDPQFPEPEKAARCLGLFEDYCIVTESVRRGVPVEVTVKGVEAP